MRSLCLLIPAYIAGVLSLSQGQGLQVPLSPDIKDFKWTSIAPTRDLAFLSCYGEYECARLDVPLNWNATTRERESNRAAIAIIRLPAKVPPSHERYGGMIVVNPGGPGESGVDQVLSRGQSIQTIVDDDGTSDGKFFDIIGFDPRGVKRSTPSLHCFPDAFSQQMWLLSRPEYGFIFDSDSAFAMEWTRTESIGRRCSANDDNKSMMRYANTAQVVEDMVAIVDGHAKWRLTQIELTQTKKSEVRLGLDAQIHIPDMLLPKLLYWGVSYGSLLGQTFAAMHPERVGRLVIDGVLRPEDYYAGTWLANLQDSDQVMTRLSSFCFEAGPKACPLYTGSSAQDVEDLITKLVFDLKTDPLAVKEESTSITDPISITFDDFYLRAIGAMAFPQAGAEDFFRLLAELKKGNVTEVAKSKQAQLEEAASLAKCRGSAHGCMLERSFGLLGPTLVIECMDSAPYRSESLPKADFWTYFHELKAQSRWFSPAWARHRMSCIGFESKPAWHYPGKIAADNTSHPLLIIGNTHDTVTPLRNARHVATLFPGAVVLQQDSEGHCSHAMPSSCTAKHVRRYFQSGELPNPGTLCQPDQLPFSKNQVVHYVKDHETPDMQDPALQQALKLLAQPWPHLML